MNSMTRFLLGALDYADRHGSRPALLTVQRGLAMVLPLVLVGAVALMVREAPLGVPHGLDALLGPAWRDLCDTLLAGTFGIASLALLCAFSGILAQISNQRRAGPFVSPVMACMVVLSCFFVLLRPQDKATLQLAFSMHRGLVLALLVSGVASTVFLRLTRISLLQLPLGTAGHDPVVRDVFTVMPAGAATIALFGLLRLGLNALHVPDLYGATQGLLFLPFAGAEDGLGFGLGYTTLSQLFWMVGAHGPNLLYGVAEQILTPADLANAAAMSQGQTPPFILTKTFFDAFTRMGGSGSTLSLILAIFLASRDGSTRKLCRIALLPALCNVNEPLLFGIPLVLNPIYCIPFLATPLLQTLTAYLATALGLIPHTTASISWTTPVIIAGYAATGSVAGALMQTANLALGVAVYLPFVRLADTLSQRQGLRVLDVLQRAASRYETGRGGHKCVDLPGEAGRLAKALTNDLHSTLTTPEHSESQLFLVYQPQLNGNGRVSGVEALLRWRHPAYGHIAPPIAVALAEDTALIDRLGLFVLTQACLQRAAWVECVPDALRVAVNVSPRQLMDPHFPAHVLRIVHQSRIVPSQLELEITESSVLEPDTRAMESLKHLQQHGVHVAIDDFGMGHASLRYLRAFPVDTVKIDRSLTQGVEGGVNDHIVRSIVELSQAMGIGTVVEGVEQPEQLERFRALGCTTFQGYLFSQPLPGADCLAFILRRQGAAI
ncbi:EAL domain-containing protein [Megalodesulfovibrio paquesii]